MRRRPHQHRLNNHPPTHGKRPTPLNPTLNLPLAPRLPHRDRRPISGQIPHKQRPRQHHRRQQRREQHQPPPPSPSPTHPYPLLSLLQPDVSHPASWPNPSLVMPLPQVTPPITFPT